MRKKNKVSIMELISAKQILSSYQQNNNWFGTNYTINLYKGCCHGCIYCDSRSACYQIEDFDTVRGKRDALNLLEKELRGKRKKGVVGMGAMSDPYNPFEKQYKLTRGALELFYHYGFGMTITTKSDLIERDKDILKEMKYKLPVLVKFTVTTADDVLAKKIERNAPPPSRRFEVIKKLSQEGIYTGILLMPVLPFLEDSDENIKAVINQAKEYDARFIYPFFGVTLRDNQREYFFEQLDHHFPGLKQQYIAEFRNSYICHSKRSRQLWQLFKEECDRAGILYRMQDIIAAYQNGYENEQLSLF